MISGNDFITNTTFNAFIKYKVHFPIDSLIKLYTQITIAERVQPFCVGPVYILLHNYL